MLAAANAGRCPGEGDSAQARRASWRWLDPEWAESQAKPQLTFACQGLGSGVKPRPSGQPPPSCRNNNNRADGYAWAHAHQNQTRSSLLNSLQARLEAAIAHRCWKHYLCSRSQTEPLAKKLAVKTRFHCLAVRFARFGQQGRSCTLRSHSTTKLSAWEACALSKMSLFYFSPLFYCESEAPQCELTQLAPKHKDYQRRWFCLWEAKRVKMWSFYSCCNGPITELQRF